MEQRNWSRSIEYRPNSDAPRPNKTLENHHGNQRLPTIATLAHWRSDRCHYHCRVRRLASDGSRRIGVRLRATAVVAWIALLGLHERSLILVHRMYRHAQRES